MDLGVSVDDSNVMYIVSISVSVSSEFGWVNGFACLVFPRPS